LTCSRRADYTAGSRTSSRGKAPSLRPLQGWEPRTINLQGLRLVLPTLAHRTRKDGAPSAGMPSSRPNRGAERVGHPPFQCRRSNDRPFLPSSSATLTYLNSQREPLIRKKSRPPRGFAGTAEGGYPHATCAHSKQKSPRLAKAGETWGTHFLLLPGFARLDSRGQLSLHGSCWPLATDHWPLLLSTCRPCRRRGRRAWRELPSFRESPRPGLRWSASSWRSSRHSAARCARPWWGRALRL